MDRNRTRLFVPPTIVAAVVAVGCGTVERTAERVIATFAEAVQNEDLDALYCLLAGAAAPPDGAGRQRADFDTWARSRYEAYQAGRDRGGGPLDEAGIVLVKTFALGKGTFYQVDAARFRGGRLQVETTVRFGYGQLNYGTFSPGTTLYLAGAPAGRIVAVRVPRGHEDITEEVLDSLRLRWELARQPAGPACPARWAVVSVTPVAGSETTSTLTWRF